MQKVSYNGLDLEVEGIYHAPNYDLVPHHGRRMIAFSDYEIKAIYLNGEDITDTFSESDLDTIADDIIKDLEDYEPREYDCDLGG